MIRVSWREKDFESNFVNRCQRENYRAETLSNKRRSIDRRRMECDRDVWAYDLTLKSEGRSYILSDNYCALLKLKFIDIAVSLFAPYNLTPTILYRIPRIFWMKLLYYKYSLSHHHSNLYIYIYIIHHNVTYLFKKVIQKVSLVILFQKYHQLIFVKNWKDNNRYFQIKKKRNRERITWKM